MTSMMRGARVLAGLSLLLLSGCGSLSGYDGGKQFACAAPHGVSCQSMSSVYAQAHAQAAVGSGRHATDAPVVPLVSDALAARDIAPQRSAVRQMRVWYAPWEDLDGDLNGPSYSYLLIDSGHWLLPRVGSAQVRAISPEVDVPQPLAAPVVAADSASGEPPLLVPEPLLPEGAHGQP